MDKLKDILDYVLIIIAVVLIRTFLFSPIRVTGPSMVPTLLDGDIMILNKIGYRTNGLERFDIVVINYKENNKTEKIIKRVIGCPGDIVEYKDNILYINGKKVEEDYTRYATDDFISNMLGVSIIPDDKYLVMGDNRPISKDSRIIGLIDKKDIMGKTSFVLFPFTRFGKVK